MTTYKERQAESTRSVMVTPEQYGRLSKYAEDNSISISEAMRDAIATYMKLDKPAPRERRSRRVTFWVAASDYLAFSKRVAEENAKLPQGAKRITINDAIDRGLGEIL